MYVALPPLLFATALLLSEKILQNTFSHLSFGAAHLTAVPMAVQASLIMLRVAGYTLPGSSNLQP